MDVIGMTNLQEAKLAREAEICYVTVAMVTDYDCWHETHDAVTVDQIIATLKLNTENARKLVPLVIRMLPSERDCKCGSALKHAIITDPAAISAQAKQRLGVLLGKYTSK